MTNKIVHHGSGGAFYGLGMIGSLVYFIQQSNTAGEIIMAFIKALVWPALLAYRLLGFLGM